MPRNTGRVKGGKSLYPLSCGSGSAARRIYLRISMGSGSVCSHEKTARKTTASSHQNAEIALTATA